MSKKTMTGMMVPYSKGITWMKHESNRCSVVCRERERNKSSVLNVTVNAGVVGIVVLWNHSPACTVKYRQSTLHTTIMVSGDSDSFHTGVKGLIGSRYWPCHLGTLQKPFSFTTRRVALIR